METDFNPKAFVDARDFDGMYDLIDHIARVDQDELAGFKRSVALDHEMPIRFAPIDRTGITHTDRTDRTGRMPALPIQTVQTVQAACPHYPCMVRSVW